MGKPSGISRSFELFRRIARRCGVPARNADDVAQDALLRGLEADQRIEPGGDAAPYRVTIACNQARNHVRDARRRGEVLTSFDEHEIRAECPTPEELLRTRQREELMRRLIGQIDPKYRDVLIKHDLEGIPLAQIAAELSLHPEAVKTQHRRAREQLEAATQRWRAKQRSRGWDDAACVAPLGLYRRQGWISSLGRWSLRVLVQGATFALTSAIVAAVTSPSGLESWLRSAIGSRWTELTEQAPVPLPAEPRGEQAGTPTAVSSGKDRAPLSEDRGGRQAGAGASATSAPSSATARRASPPATSAPPPISARERSLITRARRALEAHTAEADLEARQLLDAHAREFPRGRLAAEREGMLRQLR
ncbi:sigma-70 family RNA polymerase sigma factor [Sorangium sp. So ce185]|uniref:RNA polymerase sigma factor n=1 Tax=Sorangium sp. So ce185 TaxID=3133287 RepID=UPI003F60DCB5